MPPKPTRRRRASRALDEMPNLFDSIDIDFSRDDIAGSIIQEHERKLEEIQAGAGNSVEIDRAALGRPAQRLRFISFGSGSSGNCAYIGSDKGGVLIDAGVDAKHVDESLKINGIDPKTIAGIILTHDHSDHLRYAYTILRANKHMVLYCTPRCLNGIFRRSSISRRIRDYHRAIYKEIPFEAAGLTITAFETSHDGTDNVGFAIDLGDNHFVITTDTGIITERADYYMRQANYIMLESNYDSQMLADGPYPEYLKARIRGERGHLDNVVAAEYIARIISPRLTHLFLCHLSADNNTPACAIGAMQRAVEATGRSVGEATGSMLTSAVDLQLAALPRFADPPLYTLRPRQ